VQIAISFAVNLLIVLTASALASFFRTKPFWLRVQKWFMATALGFLAFRLATDHARK
jgi:threonine/homoserine/homoserine lactone efflux protein